MIDKVLGAIAGAKVAEHSRDLGAVEGSLLGLAASVVVRRLSVPSMLAIAAGAYLAKLHSEKRR
jgi:hypothetical protein